jgi:5-methylcytosine-specific restriction endonuclease McrA
MTVMMKCCSHCKTSKPLDQFHKSNRTRGLRTARCGFGVQATCKACASAKRNPELAKRRELQAIAAAAGLKECSVCKVEKPFKDFSRSAVTKDGLNYKCAECGKAINAKWREVNPDGFKKWSGRVDRTEYRRTWYEKNREIQSEKFAAWAKQNPHKVNALIAKRRAIKIQASPPWANQEAIRAIYAEASRLTKETGIPHEVDHIYPLQGETVCGLHVETNLQILTKVENIRKKNRMPHEAGYA